MNDMTLRVVAATWERLDSSGKIALAMASAINGRVHEGIHQYDIAIDLSTPGSDGCLHQDVKQAIATLFDAGPS